MYASIAPAIRQLSFAGIFTLLLLTGSTVAADPLPAPAATKLQEIAAWEAYGFGSATLADATVTSNGFSGKLHVDGVPNELSPEIIGFRASSQRLYNLALIYPGKALLSLLPSLKGTALAELELPQLVVLLSPPPNIGATIPLPTRLGSVTMPFNGGTAITLDASAKVLGHANLHGQTAALLESLGAPSRDLTLSGKIDPRLLKATDQQNELIDSIDLRLALRAMSPPRKPDYLNFGDSTLVMKGIGGNLAAGIFTSLTVNVGSGMHFDHVTINRDPAKRLLSIASTSVSPGANFLTLPVAGAAITKMSFHGLIDEQQPANDHFSLDGQYVVGGSTPRDFTATLSGRSPAQYAVTLQTDTTLGQLMGWSVPGLDALTLQGVSFGNGYISGNLSIKGVKFTVALFKGVGQVKYNVAFLNEDKLSLPQLARGLQGTPLADLQLNRPAFMLVPHENVGKAIELPVPVSQHLGLQRADLAYGVNLIAHADTQGEVATLLRAGSLATSNLLITGTFDPALFSGSDGPLTEAVINATSLQVALPAAAPARKPAYLTFGNSTLLIKGDSGKIASTLRTSLAINVGRGMHFDPVTISHDPLKRVIFIDSNVVTSGTDFITLPVAGAAIRQVALHGLIDEQNATNDRFALDGQYAVGGNAPKDFTATLSGGTPAQYEVTVHTDIALGQLMGWQQPGLETAVLKEVVLGNGYALGHISLKGMPFTVVVFKSDGQTKSNAAFLSDDTFGLPKLMTTLHGTPLADLELARPGFILVPRENAGNAVKLPANVAIHLGLPAVNLEIGLNLIANGNVYGDLAALLDKLGTSTKGLPIVGRLDPTILSGIDGMALAQPFLDALDLRLALRNLTLPGIAHNITTSNAYVTLKGITKGIDGAVHTTLNVNAGAGKPLVFDTGLRLVKAASGDTIAVSGVYPGAWNKPFDINWLNVRDITIKGSLGPTSTLAVIGTTDVGSVRNLTVAIDLATPTDGNSDVVVKLTGADLSLHDIPVLAGIPQAGDLKFRDLVVSSRAIGGTLKSPTLPLLHNVEAVAFELAGHWNLAARIGDIDLSKLMVLPAFAKPVLGKLKLGQTTLLLSQTNISTPLTQLPRAAQTQFAEIFASPEGMLHAVSGVNIVSLFDPSSMGPAVISFLPPGQKLVLEGSAGGVFGGGPQTLALAATIPALALPSSLRFVNLPDNARTALFINLTQTTASAGVGIDTVIAARLNKQLVNFDATIAFELDNQGGVAVDLQGKSLNPWQNPMGINGLVLDTGTRIAFKTAASSELTLTFVGKTHIGSREADITGSASIIGGVVDKGAFEAKLSELTISDVVALFNDAVKAGGGSPVKADFPDAKLKNVDIAFASPGVSLPEINLPNGGTRLAGDLWFLMRDKPLSRMKAQFTESSLVMTGDISDFTLGPVAMKGNKLDIRAQTAPPLPPLFKISGGATIMGKHVAGEVDAGLTETAVISAIDLGGLLNLDLHASFDTPASGLDAGGLAAQDMALNGHLKSDIGAWLQKEGKKAVSEVFDSVGGGVKKLVADIATAQKQVDTLNGQIVKARARANAGAKTAEQQIAAAQKKVNDLADRVNSLNHDISSEKSDIRTCDYSVSICYWWNWRGHCTKHKDVPDVARDAECEANNGRHAATLAADEAALKTAQATKLAADGVLTALKKGEKGADIASLDPEVIALEASLVLADAALLTARTAGQGAELAVDQLKAGLAALDRVDSFKLTGSTISGNFQKAVAGKPIVLGLEFEAAGKPQHLRLALSLTDPAYNAKQFDTLALFVAKAAVEALPNAAPAVTHLLNDAFKSSHDMADKEVQRAAKENGLE